MRLDKYISNCGICSRSEVKKLIRGGAVTVDGEVSKKADMQVNKDSIVRVNGKRIVYREFVYLMLNKPQGYVSAARDKKYPVVTNLIGAEYEHFNVFPVGRLDIDTEGLLILTNDGSFSHAMTSPKKNVYKRYFARLDKPMEKSDIELFASGIEFKDFTAQSAKLEITENPREVYIEIAEGKFHQVKRMCAKAGKNVVYLKRVAIGGVKLDEKLPSGAVRELTEEELNILCGK